MKLSVISATTAAKFPELAHSAMVRTDVVNPETASLPAGVGVNSAAGDAAIAGVPAGVASGEPTGVPDSTEQEMVREPEGVAFCAIVQRGPATMPAASSNPAGSASSQARIDRRL